MDQKKYLNFIKAIHLRNKKEEKRRTSEFIGFYEAYRSKNPVQRFVRPNYHILRRCNNVDIVKAIVQFRACSREEIFLQRFYLCPQ